MDNGPVRLKTKEVALHQYPDGTEHGHTSFTGTQGLVFEASGVADFGLRVTSRKPAACCALHMTVLRFAERSVETVRHHSGWDSPTLESPSGWGHQSQQSPARVATEIDQNQSSLNREGRFLI